MEAGAAARRRSVLLSAVTIVLLALAGGLAPSLLPGTLVGRDARSVAAAAIFAASYLALAVGRVPGLAIDRAGVALVGACLMVAGGALPLEDAYKAVDLDTLTLLLGMMIVVANLRLSGFFAQASAWVMRRAHHPLALLAAVTAVAGVFSAFLVNDAICLVLAPLVLRTDALAAAQPGTLPARRRDGIEHRFDRNHHRQPAKHDDRQLLANSVRAIHREPRARGTGRARADLCTDRALPSSANSRAARGSWPSPRRRASTAC